MIFRKHFENLERDYKEILLEEFINRLSFTISKCCLDYIQNYRTQETRNRGSLDC